MMYVALLLWETIHAGAAERFRLFSPSQHVQHGGGGPAGGGAPAMHAPAARGGAGPGLRGGKRAT